MTTTRVVSPPKHSLKKPKDPYRILIASAGDPSSLGAIRVATELARRKRGIVHVATVVAPFPHLASAFQVASPAVVDEENRRAALDAVRRQLATVDGATNWTVSAVMGWPADAMAKVAERWPASLVIVGLREHGVVARLFGSETAVAMGKSSTVPILAVPHTVRHLPTHALVAVDFTEASIKAATVAATLLGPSGVLTLLHISMLVQDTPEPGTLGDVYTTGAVDKLHAIRDRIREATKRKVECVVARGDILDELLTYADRERCDLLAVGGHDQGLLDRVLLGSVRTRVLRHAPCAVLIAPHVNRER